MIYFITAREIGRVKIGFSEEPRSRFVKMRTDSPIPLELERICAGDRTAEAALHEWFASDRLSGEWFNLSDTIESYMQGLQAFVKPAREASLSQIILAATGCSKSYVSQMLGDKYEHQITIPVAISVFFFNGMKIGPLADATDAEIAVLDKYCGRYSPRKSVAQDKAA